MESGIALLYHFYKGDYFVTWYFFKHNKLYLLRILLSLGFKLLQLIIVLISIGIILYYVFGLNLKIKTVPV